MLSLNPGDLNRAKVDYSAPDIELSGYVNSKAVAELVRNGTLSLDGALQAIFDAGYSCGFDKMEIPSEVPDYYADGYGC